MECPRATMALKLHGIEQDSLLYGNPLERGITQVRVQPKSLSIVAWNHNVSYRKVKKTIEYEKKTKRTLLWTWKVKKWIIMILLLCFVIYFLGEQVLNIGFPTCSATIPFHTTFESTTSGAIYVSMVSIPIMERVLPMKHLAEELIHRGYRVSFALPEICRSWVSDVHGLEFISLGTMSVTTPTYTTKSAASYVGIYTSYWSTLHHFTTYYKPMYHPLLEDYMEDPPTISVIDRYTFAAFDVCDSLGIPYIINNPFLLLDIDDPPSYVPAPYSQHPLETQTVWQRCANGFYRLRFRLVNLAISIHLQKTRQDMKISSSPFSIYGKRLVLTNTAFGLEYSRPLSPLYRMVGALRRPQAPPLTADLDSWLQISPSDTEAVVYVDFGPDIILSIDIITEMISILRRYECRVVWKISNEMNKQLEQEEDSLLHAFESWEIYLSPWISYTSLLAIPNLRFFLTSGNMYQVQEALCAGHPILAIPFTSDQVEYVDRVIRAGAGVSIDASQINMDSIAHGIHLLLTQDKFTQAAVKLGGLLDSAGGISEAANAVVAVAQRGTSSLIPEHETQPFHKTYLLDVYAVYGAVLCGVAVILRTLLSACFSVFHPKAVNKGLKVE